MLSMFFTHMPADCGMAFVVILHLPADRKSMLTEILRRWTSMPVVEAYDGAAIEPNHVYVPPPHAVVTLRDGHLGIEMPREGSERLFAPSMDSSIRWDRDGRASRRNRPLRHRQRRSTRPESHQGARRPTIAQGSNGTAPQYGEMPAGAIATGVVDIISPVEEMPGHLLRLKNSPLEVADSPQEAPTEAARLAICALLRTHLAMTSAAIAARPFCGASSGACRSSMRHA